MLASASVHCAHSPPNLVTSVHVRPAMWLYGHRVKSRRRFHTATVRPGSDTAKRSGGAVAAAGGALTPQCSGMEALS